MLLQLLYRLLEYMLLLLKVPLLKELMDDWLPLEAATTGFDAVSDSDALGVDRDDDVTVSANLARSPMPDS